MEMIAYIIDECGQETSITYNSNETSYEQLMEDYPEARFQGYESLREKELRILRSLDAQGPYY